MDFNRYFTNQELENTLNEWITTYSDLISVEVIGHSHQGRSIWLLRVTNQKTGPDTEKPAVWIDANIHARENNTGARTTASQHVYNSTIAHGHFLRASQPMIPVPRHTPTRAPRARESPSMFSNQLSFISSSSTTVVKAAKSYNG